MYIATTHRHTHANHRCYNDLHAPSTARRHCLVAPCVAPHCPLRSVKRDTSCGLIASPLAGADFATHPHGSLFESVCSVPAKSKKFFVAFAAFLQSPKSFLWRLQHSCKGQKVFRGVCSIPAKAKKFFEVLLQHSCKGQKVSWGICSVPASTQVFAFIPANDMTQLAISTF